MLICTPKKNLGHVKKHHDYHAVRSPIMHGAEEPPEFLLIVQKLKTSVRFIGGRYINQGQQDPSQDLDREAKEGHTPENVKPAGAASWDRVAAGRLPYFDEVEPLLEPHRHVCQRVDDPLFLRTHRILRRTGQIGKETGLNL